MKKIIIFVLMSIVFFGGCLSEENKCGDGTCTLDEDCLSCEQDCLCQNGSYCDEDGVCSYYTCGDEICSDDEIQACCEDCGCEGDKICNMFNQLCQDKSPVTDMDATVVADRYLADKNITGFVESVSDEYYGNETIKLVTINCEDDDHEYPCYIMLYIDSEKNIIEEMMTT